jgi:hypothetical protein
MNSSYLCEILQIEKEISRANNIEAAAELKPLFCWNNVHLLHCIFIPDMQTHILWNEIGSDAKVPLYCHTTTASLFTDGFFQARWPQAHLVFSL